MNYNCGICQQEFNSNNRIPRVLQICCGRILCSQCLAENFNKAEFKCPFDKKKHIILDEDIGLFPTQECILELIDRAHRNGKPSSQHRKPQKEGEVKMKQLKEGISRLEEQSNQLNSVLESSTNKFLKIVQEKFKVIKRKLNTEEVEISDKIRAFFEIEKTKIRNTLGIDSTLRQEIANIINKMDQTRDESQWETMSQRVMRIENKLKYLLTKDHNLEYEKVLAESSAELGAHLDSLISSFPKMGDFSNKSIVERLNGIYLEDYNNEALWEPVVRKQDLSQIKHLMNFKKKEGWLIISNSKIKIEEGFDADFNQEDLKTAAKVHCKLGGSLIETKNKDALGWVWTQLEKVESMKLGFVAKGTTDDVINVLPWQALREIKLQEIDIDLKGCTRITDQSFQNIIKCGLNNVDYLSKVSLDISSTRLKTKSLETFSKILQPVVNNLKDLKLSLMKTDIWDQGLTHLFSEMKRMKKFSLNLYFTKVTDESVEKFAKNSLKTMSLLEEFELDLGYNSVTDKSISSMFIAMPNLKSFILRLGKCKISDKSLIACVEKTLPTFKDLKVFEMDLRETGVTDQGVAMIWPALKNLNSFKLNLGGIPNLTDASIQGMSNCKVQIMRTLEAFDLNLEGTSITGEKISQIFTNTNKAKRYSMNFAKNSKVGDQILYEFVGSCLLSMRSLAYLSLNLSETKVTDDGIKNLFLNIKSASGLQNFELYLQKTKVSDRTIEIGLEKIKKDLKCLGRLVIDLTQTEVSADLIAQVLQYQQKIAENKLPI